MRRIVIVRHGERLDYTFGRDWIEKSFDDEGRFLKSNFNMPDDVIQRAGSPRSFWKDGPLTQVGQLQGKLVGKGLRHENVLRPGYEVYVSPSYRSIQTATALMEGIENKAPLKIEPCLFEWTGWYSDGIPSFVTYDELTTAGYKADPSYKPYMPASELQVDEEVENYYNRTYEFIKRLLESSDNDLVLVAHGCTLETGSRQLMGKPARKTFDDFLKVLHDVPYAATAVVEYDPAENSWGFLRNDRLCMKHTAINNFDCHQAFVRD